MSKKKKKRPPGQAAGWRARMTPDAGRGPSGRSGSATTPGADDPGPVSGFRAPAGTRDRKSVV